MRKLDKKAKEKLTMDWQRALPDMGVLQPMRLLRRVGPLLSGVCLYRDGAGHAYVPTAHVHCLAVPWESVSLSMMQRLRTTRTHAEDWIEVKWHDKLWEEAASRLIAQSLLPLRGGVTLEHIDTAFSEASGRGDLLMGRSSGLYQDWLLTHAWAGRVYAARNILQAAVRDIATWPVYVMERQGGLDAWVERMEHLISAPEILHRTVEEELVRHKADGLPAVDTSAWIR